MKFLGYRHSQRSDTVIAASLMAAAPAALWSLVGGATVAGQQD